MSDTELAKELLACMKQLSSLEGFAERCAELLYCDSKPAVICVAIQDLQDQLHNAKKMIVYLRGENARLASELQSFEDITKQAIDLTNRAVAIADKSIDPDSARRDSGSRDSD